jgi:hypothetical protein
MQWSDVTSPPSSKTLRQFAGLWLVVLGGLAGWRAWHGQMGGVTGALAVLAVVVGVAGLVRPATVRVVYAGAMSAAFPIGWTVSRLVLVAMFYLVFAPVAIVFRLLGRDALRLRRRGAASYWMPYVSARKPEDYFRQF